MKKHMGRVSAALVTTAAMTLCSMMPAFAAASGDVNRDSSFNLSDVVAFSQYLIGANGNLADAAAADYDSNGRLNAVDLTLMKRALIEGSSDPDPVVTDDTYVTQVTFASNSVTLKNANDEVVSASSASNITVTNGTYVTITMETTTYGDVNVDGSCSAGQLKVDVAGEEDEVVINLRGLTLSNTSDSPIYIANCGGECTITSKNGTVNTISDGTSYTNADGGAGAIYSCDDLKFKGKGELIVNGNCGDGIVSKDDLKIWNGTITVTAADDGIRGKDTLRIGDPDDTDYSALNVTVTSKGGDGLKSTNDTSGSGKGYVRINGGTVNITAEYGDAIQGEQAVYIYGGDINLYTYQGSNFTGSGSSSGSTGGWGGMQDGNSNKTDISAKGIKAVGLYDEAGTTWQSDGNIVITGGTITADTSDDAIHCGGDMTITGGVFSVASADDAFHSDHTLTIGTANAGTFDDVKIYVSKAYEGIEGVTINQNSGTVYIVSTDDGYNAAGGADGSGTGTGSTGGPGFGQGGMSTSSGTLNLNGGLAVVNTASGDHDAFDSNGNFTITGGYYCANGQEPMDYDGSFSNNGGSYITMQAGNTNLTTRYSFCDNSGNVIVSFVSASGGGATTTNCTAYSGGTVSGGTELLTQSPYQIYMGGTLSGGTTVGAGSSSGGSGQNPWG